MLVTSRRQSEEYYQALVERDSSYTGIFFAAVKTTSIFCIATCRARKPKPENVDFYSDMKSVLAAGFRPCKICRPTENARAAPAEVQKAIEIVRAAADHRVNDQALRKAGLLPETIRRWFKREFGLTFQAWQRMLRINHAVQSLGKGGSAINASLEAGYESLSGFNYSFKNLLGYNPATKITKNLIHLQRFTTPLGPMFVCATGRGVCLLEFCDRRMLETEFRDIQKRFQSNIIAGDNPHCAQAQREIGQYFAGERKVFEVELDTPGTDFQRKVWQALRDIDYGRVVSYQDQAVRIGRPDAVRAVASANGHNRVAIIIPCHRVIGKDGNLTGYGGGLARKQWLLEHEGSL